MLPRITNETASKRLRSRDNAAGDCCSCLSGHDSAKQLECSAVCIDRRGFQSVIAHIALRCAATEGLLLLGSDECDRGSLGVETKNDPKVAGYLVGPHEPPAVFFLDAC